MTILHINTGTSANKGDGDTIRLAFHKVNLNFAEVVALTEINTFSNITIQNTATIENLTVTNVLVKSTATIQDLYVNGVFNVGQIQALDDFNIIKDDLNGLNFRVRNTNNDSFSAFQLLDAFAGGLTIRHQNLLSASPSFESGHHYIFGNTPQNVLNIGRFSNLNLYANAALYTNPLATNVPSITIQASDGRVIINKDINIDGDIIPQANALYDLGSPFLQWRSLYVSTSTIYIGGVPVSVSGNQLTVNGNPVSGGGAGNGYTGSAGPTGYTGSFGATGYTGSFGATGYTGSSGISNTLVNGTYTVELANTGPLNLPPSSVGNARLQSVANIDILSDTALWTFSTDSTLTAPGHIIPNADLAYDLGSTSSQWRSLYVGTSTVYFGGTPFTVSADGTISVAGNEVIATTGVTSITAGTGTAISTSTGAVTIWATSEGGAGVSTTSTLVNGTYTVSLSNLGLTQFPVFEGGSLFIQGAELGSAISGIGISAKDNVFITADILGTPKQWGFATDGSLTVPGNIKAIASVGSDGNDLTVQAGETVTGNGGDLTLKSGETTSGNAGVLNVRAGDAITGDGGMINVRAGDAVTGDAGDIDVRAGDAITGDGGSITITAGSTVNNGPGGSITITSGGNVNNDAGDINLVAATSSAGADGVIRLTGAAGTWQFGSDGNLTLPNTTSTIRTEAFSNFGTDFPSIVLTPDPTFDQGQGLRIYAGFSEAGHLHLTASTSTTDLFLGNDDQYVKVSSNGMLELNGNQVTLWGDGVMASNAYMNLPNNLDSDTTSVVLANYGAAGVLIQTGNTSPPNNWEFSSTGTLTLPNAATISDFGGATLLKAVNGIDSVSSGTTATSGGSIILQAGNAGADDGIDPMTGASGGVLIIAGGNGTGQFTGGSVAIFGGADANGDFANVVIGNGPGAFTFYGNGTLEFPDGTTQTTAAVIGAATLGDRLTSSTYNVILEGTTGTLSVPNVIIAQGYELGLAGSQGSYEVNRYLRVRDGDVYSHLHLDTPDNNTYDIILGNDSKFVKVDHTGTVVIGTNNGTQNLWTFSDNGILTFPDGTTSTGATIFANSSSYKIQTISFDGSPSNIVSTYEFGVGSITIPGNGTIYNEGQSGYWALDGVNGNFSFPNNSRISYGLNNSGLTEDDLKIQAINTGNVVISANGADWVFGTDGNLTFPSGSDVTFDNSATSYIYGVTGIEFADGTTMTTAVVGGGAASTVDITDTNGLTTIYYPIFVENRTTGQTVRADVDLTYRTDDNILGVGNIAINGTTNSTGTTTGALTVAGGVGIGGDLWAGNIYSNGVQLTAGGGGGGVTSITAGTGTFVSASSGAVTVWVGNTSNLEETFESKTTATGVIVHDCTTNRLFYHTGMTGNFTANFTNLSLSSGEATSVSLVLVQGGTARMCTAVQIASTTTGVTLLWQGAASAPTGNASRTEVVTFSILCTGSNAYTVLGMLTSFGGA